MAKGVDASVPCTPVLACLEQNGVEFVGRYYANHGGKVLTLAEAQAISQAGLKIVAVWEDGFPTKASYFSYAKGVDDGTSAYHDAQALGQPVAAPIYFAVDYDATPDDVAGPVLDYFRGIQAGFQAAAAGGPVHPVGVYGSGAVCQYMLGRQLARYAWLTQSTGWRGTAAFGAWNIKQSAETKLCGIDVDGDEGAGDYGGFVI